METFIYCLDGHKKKIMVSISIIKWRYRTPTSMMYIDPQMFHYNPRKIYPLSQMRHKDKSRTLK